MITPRDFLKLVIGRWEGGYESYASDAGNWVTDQNGNRIDVGTMRGVTPQALAAHRGVAPWTLTPAIMQAITLDEAADIGLKHYYQEPHFDLLKWSPASAALLDFGWGAGPGQAAKSMQRIVGTPADGGVGPLTAAAYNAWLERVGAGAALAAIHDMRADFYREVVAAHPEDAKFLPGWLNRDDWASASNAEFLNSFS